jgi:hypothetical protein
MDNNHVHDDARSKAGSCVLAVSNNSAPSLAFAGKSRIGEHIFNEASDALCGDRGVLSVRPGRDH